MIQGLAIITAITIATKVQRVYGHLGIPFPVQQKLAGAGCQMQRSYTVERVYTRFSETTQTLRIAKILTIWV